MAKALYRKYRPKTLADVIGQEQVTDVLANSIKKGKISHAYLFTGPRGTGKTSVARIFAHEINHFKYELEDDYVDIVEIDAASNTGVDNIRELREKAVIAPSQGKYKIYIIDEVHMLSKSAFNALLKTLEEPPEHVVFIMATTDAYKVPVTITSRAQTFTFKLADSATMFKHLKNIVEAEKIPINDAALEIVARRGGGSFRDTLSLLDQIATLSAETITAEVVTNALGLPQDQMVADLLSAYKNGDFAKITATLKDILSGGIKPEILAEEIIGQIIANPEPALLPLLSKLPEVKDNFPEAKLLLAFAHVEPSKPQAVSYTVAKRTVETTSTAKVETTVAATAVSEPNPEPVPSSSSVDLQNFNWQEFISVVRETSSGAAINLEKSNFELLDGSLYIYPSTSMAKKILERNMAALIAAANGLTVLLGEKKSAQKDQTLGAISDIMGNIQEVQDNGGGTIPF